MSWLFPQPPPPPPPPPSLHLLLSATSSQFLLAAAVFAGIALLVLLLGSFLTRSAKAPEKPLVSVEPAAYAKERIAVLATTSKEETPLVKHVKRLLLERGFLMVRVCLKVRTVAELDEACKEAHLVIDLTYEASDNGETFFHPNSHSTPIDIGGTKPVVEAGTIGVLRASSARYCRTLLQVSDALVGYDDKSDVCDGDELSDPGISLISPEPRPAPPSSDRLKALKSCEERLAKHYKDGKCANAIILRLHRVYTEEALPSFFCMVAAFVSSGLSSLFVNSSTFRAQTNLIHVQDAAYGITLAVDRLLDPTSEMSTKATGGVGAGGLETIVLTDPTVWTVSHLLRCLACVLRVPSPIAPFLLPPLFKATDILITDGLTPILNAVTHVAGYLLMPLRLLATKLLVPILSIIASLLSKLVSPIMDRLTGFGGSSSSASSSSPPSRVTALLSRILSTATTTLTLLLTPLKLLATVTKSKSLWNAHHFTSYHSYFTAVKAEKTLGFTPKATTKGLHAFLLGIRQKTLPLLRLTVPLLLFSLTLLADAYNKKRLTFASTALLLTSIIYSVLPPPKTLPEQPPIAPPLVFEGSVPILGHLLSFIKGPVGMIDALRSKYRSMFTIMVGPQRITFMIGAGPQYQFIKAKDEVLDQAPVYGFTIPVFGEGIVYDSPLDERQQQVKLLVHSMNTKGLEAMVPKMIEEAEEYFAAWGNEGEVELRNVFSELIIMTASSCLMGPEIRENLSAEIARIYHALDGGLTPLSTLWPSAPTQKHKERDEARAEMVSIFSKIIAARRTGDVKADDFLQKIIDFTYRDETDPKTGKVIKAGRGFSDSEVTGWLIVLLFAGQHTSSITATWLGCMLLSHPEAMKELKKEQERMVPDEKSLNYSNLLEMDGMRRAITESLRLYPPLILLMRKVMLDGGLKVGEHTIPKGDVVGLCAPASNLDPRYWSDATQFKPERYLPGAENEQMFDSRSVGHGLMQGFMLSFGGGAHMCSGRRFGYLQVSTIWTILLRDFEMEMTTPVPKPAYNDMVVGPDAPIIMKYKRKVPLTAEALTKRAKPKAVAEGANGVTNGHTTAAPAAEAVVKAGVSLSRKRPSKEDFPRGPLIILWGSQTGTAEGFGNDLMREARQRGFNAKSLDLEEYDHTKLSEEDEAPVIFLMATHGEGEPTDNAMGLFKYLEEERCDNLKSLKYTAFALGNKQYEHFCAMGKWIDSKAKALGATRLYELGLGDDDDDLEGDFEKWREGLWKALCPDLAAGGDGAATMAMAAPAAQFECEWLEGENALFGGSGSTLDFQSRSLPKHKLYECEVKENRELCEQPQFGSVKHIELSTVTTGEKLTYHTADDLAVCCDNGLSLASKVAKRLNLSLDAVFALKPLPSAGDGAHAPLPTPCTVEHALRYYTDLRAPVSKQLLLLLADSCKDSTEASKLSRLASTEGKQEYHDYITRDGRGLAELLLDVCPSCNPPWACMLELCAKLSPRFYTISSSPEADNKTVHLTVKVLREPMRGAAEGRTKEGICSTQLGELAPGMSACVFVRSSGFHLPSDLTAPVIMVGPGTGIAPFRAFLQQIQTARQWGYSPRTGDVRLYFGCRRENEDYLYRDELSAYMQAGALTSLRIAFSRQQAEKVYVQHKVREDGKELWELLNEKNGHFYICGGTSMGRDVVAALQEAVVAHGNMTEEAAGRYIREMQAQGRLVQELWS